MPPHLATLDLGALQSLLCLPPVGQHRVEHAEECRAMVWVFEVAEFVDDEFAAGGVENGGDGLLFSKIPSER